ncbi:MAG: DUF2927 domain-containing protein [Pseudomonadota bacterium]
MGESRRAVLARWAISVGLCACAMALAGAAAASSAYERQLTRQFGAIAFTAEIGGEHRRGRLIRWTGPIRAQIFEGEAYRDEVLPVLAQLSRMTGVPITTPADYSGVNLEIRIVPRGVYRDIAGAGIDEPCLTLVDSYPATGAIAWASVVIQSDDPYLRRHCIVEELTQAMGLMDDSTVFARSVFNDRSRATQLTLEDRIMLALLYDRRLSPNMPRDLAMRLAPQIIGDLRRRASARARAAAGVDAAHPAAQASATTSSRPQ